MFGFSIIRTSKLKHYKEFHGKYTHTYNKYIQYKLAYEDCLNIINPEQLKIIKNHLKELIVL